MQSHTKIVGHSGLNPEGVLKPSFEKADYSLINAFLATIDWDIVYADCRSAEEYLCARKGIVNTAIYNFVPFVNVGDPKNVPWFNRNLKCLRAVK